MGKELRERREPVRVGEYMEAVVEPGTEKKKKVEVLRN